MNRSKQIEELLNPSLASANERYIRESLSRVRNKNITDRDVQRLRVAYEAGASTRELAEQFGFHRNTIAKHLKRAGVQLRRKTRRLRSDQIAKAAQLYKQDWTLAQLARHFEVGQETMRRNLHDEGIQLRARGGRSSTT